MSRDSLFHNSSPSPGDEPACDMPATVQENGERTSMKQTVTRERAAEIAAKHGIGMLSPDDPIYNEQPTISFSTRHGKSTGQPSSDSDSPPSEPSAESDSPSKSE